MKKTIELKQEDFPEIPFDKIFDVPEVNNNKKGKLTIKLELKEQ